MIVGERVIILDKESSKYGMEGCIDKISKLANIIRIKLDDGTFSTTRPDKISLSITTKFKLI